MVLRPRSLNCPNCGSPIAIRNAFRAKTVVCTACDSLLGSTGQQYDVLAKLDPKKFPSRGYLCVGMKGVHEDAACEVIGRVRYEEKEARKTYVWDEWLILTATGTYFWIEEEDGCYTHHRVVQTATPPERSSFEEDTIFWGSPELQYGYRVFERGEATITYVEGELTWRATVGDPVRFLAGKSGVMLGGSRVLTIEYTDSEIEFFLSKPIKLVELFEMFQMTEHLNLEAAQKAVRRKTARLPSQLVFSMLFMMGAASFMFCCYSFPFRSKVASIHVDHLNSISVAAFEEQVFLSRWDASYQLGVYTSVVAPMDVVTVILTSPSGSEKKLFDFKLDEPGWGFGTGLKWFSVPESGLWTFTMDAQFNGTPVTTAPTGYRLSKPSKSGASIGLHLFKNRFASGWWLMGSGALFVLSLLHLVGSWSYITFRRRGEKGMSRRVLDATAALHERTRSERGS